MTERLDCDSDGKVVLVDRYSMRIQRLGAKLSTVRQYINYEVHSEIRTPSPSEFRSATSLPSSFARHDKVRVSAVKAGQELKATRVPLP